MATKVTRTKITGLTDATWLTVDLKTYFPEMAGATFVMIEVNGTSPYSGIPGVRAKGSATSEYNFSGSDTEDLGFIFPSPIGPNDEIEIYASYAGRIDFYIHGYGSEINWITPVQMPNGGSQNTWNVIDISAVVPADAKYAVCRSVAAGSYQAVGELGNTTDIFKTNVDPFGVEIVELTTDKRFEYQYPTSGNAPTIIGWIGEGNYKYIKNPTARSVSAADTFETFPDSDASVSFAQMAVDLKVSTADGGGEIALREKGQTGIDAWHRAVYLPTQYVPTNNGEIEFAAKTIQGDFWYRGGFVANPTGPAPSVTVSGDIQPGASFTLNYGNYDAVPVSPVTMTDSAGNSITVPVTISDSVNGTTGKHEGTATGTMPALPSSGSIAGLKFGTVNVSLSSA